MIWPYLKDETKLKLPKGILIVPEVSGGGVLAAFILFHGTRFTPFSENKGGKNE